MVGSHLQKAAYSHAKPDASTITQQNVQNHLVPPAFSKVRQQMHEEKLWEQEIRRKPALKFLHYEVKETGESDGLKMMATGC